MTTMKTYIINIVTVTKTKELYEHVAVNNFPIVVQCESISRLQDILRSEMFSTRIKEELKTKHLYEQGMYYIRELLSDGTTKDIIYNVPEYTTVIY